MTPRSPDAAQPSFGRMPQETTAIQSRHSAQPRQGNPGVFVKVHIQRIKKLSFCQGCQTLKNSQGKPGTSKKRREGG
jgi:hypothetical protein